VSKDVYENPLITRYASREMAHLFGMEERIRTWRRLWVWLAESEAELGIDITPGQLRAMRGAVETIDWDVAEAREREVRHDVMAHVHAFGEAAPEAAGIIHLGATSCFVTDNADLLILREALRLIAKKTAGVLRLLKGFASEHRALPMLGFTHMQPAQPTTLGKRATLWMQDLLLDLTELEARIDRLPARGVKGTTGTQASFLSLFDGDHAKVQRLDELVVGKMGFDRAIGVSGQTYTRKLDSQILAALAGVAESAHKFATDLRLLAHRKEVEEPFAKKQIGSSAMAYKRNPMRSERICSLARLVLSLAPNGWMTHATQWMERTLDDSANRRLSLPQAFLAADAVLELCANVADGLVVYPKVVEKNLRAELPFMATEAILMAGVRAGGDRQELHERIRVHARDAARRVKEEGEENDLLERLAGDEAFASLSETLNDLMDPAQFVGRAPEQVDAFLARDVTPALASYPADTLGDAVRV
jgi:adenylosuccinate lyase